MFCLLFVCVCVCVCLSVCLSVILSVCLSCRLSIGPSVFPPVHPCMHVLVVRACAYAARVVLVIPPACPRRPRSPDTRLDSPAAAATRSVGCKDCALDDCRAVGRRRARLKPPPDPPAASSALPARRQRHLWEDNDAAMDPVSWKGCGNASKFLTLWGNILLLFQRHGRLD